MTEQRPSVGRIVHYTLTEQDASAINKRRDDAKANLDKHRADADGSQVHTGNAVRAGDVYPLVITRVWGDSPDSAVNGQLMLDGNDTYWVTSTNHGEGERHFVWPTRT